MMVEVRNCQFFSAILTVSDRLGLMNLLALLLELLLGRPRLRLQPVVVQPGRRANHDCGKLFWQAHSWQALWLAVVERLTWTPPLARRSTPGASGFCRPLAAPVTPPPLPTDLSRSQCARIGPT